MARQPPSADREVQVDSKNWSRFATPDVIAGFVVIGVCIFFLWYSERMPPESAAFPKAVLWLATVLGVVLLIQATVKVLRTGGETRFFKHRRRFFIAIVITGVYVLVLDVVGFYTSTVVLIPLVGALFGYRNPKGLILTTVIFVVAMVTIFDLLMNRHFPTEFFLR